MFKAQGSEINYELHSLGWKAFQNLCSTIVSEIWGQTIQIFFDSQDGGRDGAFNGNWCRNQSDNYSGTYTVQCKFTANNNKLIKLSDLSDEVVKAKRLAEQGLADNYFLFTNAKLTGKNDEVIRNQFESITNLNKCVVYGRERISQMILESKKLRMMVPRIYGLGDLSQILDQRAYEQAQEILSSLGDDLNKFIITDAYRQSAKALEEHGFVLLLGEPMCGKSTIAAALAMGALDAWGCSTVKVRDADDFVKHFNPNEKQLFWVDDAFGPTQIDWSSAINWSKTFPHVNAAIRKGAKVIFTSRDYVYKSARQHLKESALPVIKESQVVIEVLDLSKDEKEEILYNHIRLGNQHKTYKTDIKPYLAKIASNKKFSPEIARRLGDSFFTKNLYITEYDLNQFIQKPLDMLCEIINTMDDPSRAALALVFIRGGTLPSPPTTTLEEKEAVERLGGTIGEAIKSLTALDGSLLLNSLKDGSNAWHFKHPTIRDAFAAIVASSPDLLDIYLKGAPLEKLFSEISCGNVGLQGVSVIVPVSQHTIVINKIRAFDTSKWFNKSSLYRFLSYRCSKEFLSDFVCEFPYFISSLSVSSNIYASSDVNVLVRLNALGLLPEDKRLEVVSKFKDLAVNTPDSGFLRSDIRDLMSSDELTDILELVKNTLLPNLETKIMDWWDEYDGEDEPESYFEELKSAIDDYKEVFEDVSEARQLFEEGSIRIDEIIEQLQSDYLPQEESDFWDRSKQDNSPSSKGRSIFEDVDKE